MQPNTKRTFPLVVVGGPSGAGKDTLIKSALAQYAGKLLHSQLTTTRKPRGGEESHRFVSLKQFAKHQRDGEFIERAQVYGNWYGRLWDDLSDEGCVITQELIGFDKLVPLGKVVTVFVAPPSLEVLYDRLRSRGTESEASLQIRIVSAKKELSFAPNYRYMIVNENIVASLEQLFTILDPLLCTR